MQIRKSERFIEETEVWKLNERYFSLIIYSINNNNNDNNSDNINNNDNENDKDSWKYKFRKIDDNK